MRRLVFPFAVVAAIAGFPSTKARADRSRPPVSAAAEGLTVVVRIEEGRASIGLPTAPRSAESSFRFDDGTLVRRFTGTAAEAGIEYEYFLETSARVYGGNVLDRLTTLVDDFLDASEDAEVVHSQAVWTRGFPGVDLELLERSSGRTRMARILVGRARTYGLMLSAQRGQERALAARRAAYFGSLVLDAADAPSTLGDGRYTRVSTTWLYPPEAGFAVELPGRAARADLRITLGDHDYNGYRYSLVGGSPTARFDVVVVSFEGRDPGDVLASLEAQILGANGTVRSTRETAREGYAAREFAVEHDGNVRHALVIRTTDAAYVVACTTAVSDEAAVAGLRERFFRTFRILGVDP